MDLQLFVVLLVVTLAILFCIRRVIAAFRSKSSCQCNCGCDRQKTCDTKRDITSFNR